MYVCMYVVRHVHAYGFFDTYNLTMSMSWITLCLQMIGTIMHFVCKGFIGQQFRNLLEARGSHVMNWVANGARLGA